MDEQAALVKELGQVKQDRVTQMFPDDFTKFFDSVGTQASDALAAGLTDRALNGFRNMEDIARNIFSNLANQGINLLVKTGLNYLGGYAEGGDFIADRPCFIQVGERGAERVTVEPLTGSNAGKFGRGESGGGGSVTLNLNVNGSLGGMSRSEVKNIVKAAYMEAVTKGNSVRRVNASQSRRSL